MKALAMMAVLMLALAGCKQYECVAQGPVDVDDYMPMPMMGPNNTMTVTMQYTGSHKEIGCVEWREKKETK